MAVRESDIAALIARWDSGEGKPYKGGLIDLDAYLSDQTNIGCMCAQGQVLHELGGWSPENLLFAAQPDADRATARLLNISIAHSVLLRVVNDSVDGAPSIVLTHPEKVLGDQAHIVLAFWRHIDRMSEAQCADAARNAAGSRVRASTESVASEATSIAANAAVWRVRRARAGVGLKVAAANACTEIQGARVLREQGSPFFFLPMFGFADPEAVLAADQLNEESRNER